MTQTPRGHAAARTGWVRDKAHMAWIVSQQHRTLNLQIFGFRFPHQTVNSRRNSRILGYLLELYRKLKMPKTCYPIVVILLCADDPDTPSGAPLSTQTTNVPKHIRYTKTSIPEHGTCKLVTILAIALLIANRFQSSKRIVLM